MSKRPNMLKMSELTSKKAKSDRDAGSHSGRSAASKIHNPFMSQPIINPQQALCQFLLTARNDARKLLTRRGESLPATKPFVEIEARIGTIKSPMGLNDMRILASGPKTMKIKEKQTVVNAFLINSFSDQSNNNANGTSFVGGITRSHFTKWTGAGLAEPSPITHAFGIKKSPEDIKMNVKQGALKETEMVETVYAGYPKNQRLCFPGEHPLSSMALKKLQSQHKSPPRGHMETKEKMTNMDIALPSAPYDLRLTLATETVTDENVREPPVGYTAKRLKRRRSYSFKSFAWQLDITEVSNADDSQKVHTAASSSNDANSDVSLFELEMELNATQTLKLVNAPDGEASTKMCWTLAQQLWYMLGQINALSDILEVDSYIQPHPDNAAVKLAVAQCGALRAFKNSNQWSPAIHSNPEQQQHLTPKSYPNLKFIGCMPVNFSRHNIEEVQRAEGGYFLSEKTDGVRYLMVFTGKSVVLVDRAMKGNQPVIRANDKSSKNIEPFARIIPLIQPGTVLDGEVVINRKYRRPIFIVFDVMCCGKDPVLHLNFADRLKHLRQASFRTKTANRDMFASPSDLKNPELALPLVRKNFVQRMDLDNLISHVVEERGLRSYTNGEFHNHLTDGIIFQPNRPYVLGTDVHLLKWKYLDTVTIDVEILPQFDSGNGYNNNNNNAQSLRVGVLGEEGTMVDMSRFVRLPTSELLRLEADRNETKAKIAEVGFNPETGEWYYLTMRPDKIASNHISTVLGTLMELAESLGVDELRYRMSVKSGARDTYRKDVRRMMKQLLTHQRQANGGGR